MSSQPPIDLNQLSEILGTAEAETLSEMLTLFIDTFPPMLSPLKTALESQQPIALHDAAHAAKSASSNAAAPRLTALLRYLEIEASSENWGAFSEAIEEVKSEFDLIAQFCRNRQAEN